MQKIHLLPTKAHNLLFLNILFLNFVQYSQLGYSSMRFLQALQKGFSNT